MSMEMINSLQSEIMEHLATYGFLTGSQFMLLTGKSAGYIREMLGSLSRRGFVRSFRMEVSYQVRSENMYVNTPLAVEYLTSHKHLSPDDVKTTSKQIVVKDFFHRFNTVTVNIMLRRHLISLGIPVHLMLSYFDKQGSAKKQTLTARTKVPLDGQGFLIPDSVFKTDKSLLFVEMYCDKGDVKRVLYSLAAHARAITLATPAKAFDIPVDPLILSVFEHPGTMKGLLKKLVSNESFMPVAGLFFFATLEDVKKDCSTAWHTIHNEHLVFT